MADALDIKEVKPSPHTSYNSTEVYNPLDEDFEFAWDGHPYTIPAKSKGAFVEFIAYHGAKHLAKKIVNEEWETKIQRDVGRQQTDAARQAVAMQAVPVGSVDRMQKWLLNPVGIAPTVETPAPPVEVPPVEPPAPEPPVAKPPEPEVEKPKEPEKEEPKEEPKKELTTYEKRVKALEKARKAKKKKKSKLTN